ncbi:MAG: hypothetical protein J6E41_07150 [Lachnospiraceae bacterium]|nr:hypothetical protein [Lachnospiraceae bacterium]
MGNPHIYLLDIDGSCRHATSYGLWSFFGRPEETRAAAKVTTIGGQ